MQQPMWTQLICVVKYIAGAALRITHGTVAVVAELAAVTLAFALALPRKLSPGTDVISERICHGRVRWSTLLMDCAVTLVERRCIVDRRLAVDSFQSS